MSENAEPPRRRSGLLFRMLRDLRHAKAKIHHTEHKMVAKTTLASHLAYYGLVGAEAHGNYRYAAMVVGVLLIAEAFLGHGEVPGGGE